MSQETILLFLSTLEYDWTIRCQRTGNGEATFYAAVAKPGLLHTTAECSSCDSARDALYAAMVAALRART